jgi:hypothetical protein
VRLDKHQLGLHLPWAIVALSITLLLSGWYLLASFWESRWLGGGSAAALACGSFAGFVILFEMLLWPRKYFRRLRLIPARHWMAAHIWLGLASFPLAIFHTGFHFGGTLPTALIVIFILTILSGVYGLILQNILPKLSFHLLPAETIYSQIDHVSKQNLQDMRQILTASCGPRDIDIGDRLASEIGDDPDFALRSAVVVGAVREVGMVKGRTLRAHSIVGSRSDRDILWEAFAELEPFISKGKAAGGKFRFKEEGLRWFNQLRRACQPNSQSIVDVMQEYFLLRHQFELQRTLHHWLHAWLPVHIGLSVAVTVLLIVHVLTALRYW